MSRLKKGIFINKGRLKLYPPLKSRTWGNFYSIRFTLVLSLLLLLALPEQIEIPNKLRLNKKLEQ